MFAVACQFDADAEGGDVAARLASVRVRGRIGIELAVDPRGKTYAASVAEAGGYRVRFPRHTDRCEAVLINTGGGMAGGDQVAFEVLARDGAKAIVTAPSAERIYRSAGPDTEVRVRLSVGSEASLAWMPQETILYSGSRLDRRLDVDIAASATLLVSEIIVFGRKAMGERLAEGSLTDHWRVRRDGRLVFAEAVRLGGMLNDVLVRPAVARGAHVIATLLCVAPDAEERLEAVRNCLDRRGRSPSLRPPRQGQGPGSPACAPLAGVVWEDANTAASAWNGLLCVRSIGDSVEAVRRDIARVAQTLLREPMPRVWGDQKPT